MIKKALFLSGILCLVFANFTNAQCITGNCKNGQGTFVFPSGAKYIGEFKNGEIHGIGVCYYTDGGKYSGEWKNRYPDGRGTRTYADGYKRTGHWKKGKPTDEAGNIQEDYIAKRKEERSDDGTNIQTGCIDGDCKNGTGKFAYPDGSKYEGTFTNGKFQGQGLFSFANGDKYTGLFNNNFPHGQGSRTSADGRVVETGEWRDGEFIGSSLIEEGKTGCIEGNCDNGKGTFIFKQGAAKYTGDFKDSQPQGSGVCLYANGDRYKGEWANGAFDGKGILYKHDRSEVVGYWHEGQYVGKEAPKDYQPVATKPTEKPAEKPISEPTTPPSSEDAKVWAIVIGVASYSHMPVLRYTDDDAYKYYAFLKSLEGGALPDEQVRILIDEDATRDNVLENIKDVFDKAASTDLVIMYFSGHGLNGSFLPIDFDGFNNKIQHEEIAELFNKCKAKYKLCIADACHSGSLIAMRSTEAEPVITQYYQMLAKSVSGTALIMSSKSDETSLESAGLRQGVFTHFLIRGLKGEADANKDKVVAVDELYDYVFKQVRDYTGNRQSPIIKGTYDPAMPIGVLR